MASLGFALYKGLNTAVLSIGNASAVEIYSVCKRVKSTLTGNLNPNEKRLLQVKSDIVNSYNFITFLYKDIMRSGVSVDVVYEQLLKHNIEKKKAKIITRVYFENPSEQSPGYDSLKLGRVKWSLGVNMGVVEGFTNNTDTQDKEEAEKRKDVSLMRPYVKLDFELIGGQDRRIPFEMNLTEFAEFKKKWESLVEILQ